MATVSSTTKTIYYDAFKEGGTRESHVVCGYGPWGRGGGIDGPADRELE